MGTSKCSPCLKLLLDAALDSAGLSSQTAPQILAAYSVTMVTVSCFGIAPRSNAVVVDLLVAQGAFGLALQLELAGELHRNLRGYTQKRAKMSATHRNRACVVSCGDVARCQPPPFAGRCATSAPCTVLGCPRQRAKLTVRQEQQSNCS